MMREYEDPFAEIRELFTRLVENSMTGPGGFAFRTMAMGGDPGMQEPSGRTGVEVHRNGDEVILVTELPGVTEEQVTVGFEGGCCIIGASDGERQIRKTVLVPEPIPSSVRKTFRNGVLELVFRARAEPAGQTGI